MFIYGFLAFLALSAVISFIAVKNSPLGYEDETGFHFLEDEPVRIINKKIAA